MNSKIKKMYNLLIKNSIFVFNQELCTILFLNCLSFIKRGSETKVGLENKSASFRGDNNSEWEMMDTGLQGCIISSVKRSQGYF